MISAQRQIFVIARVFHKNVLIAVIAAARHYQRELSNLLPTGHLPAQSLWFEILEKYL